MNIVIDVNISNMFFSLTHMNMLDVYFTCYVDYLSLDLLLLSSFQLNCALDFHVNFLPFSVFDLEIIQLPVSDFFWFVIRRRKF